MIDFVVHDEGDSVGVVVVKGAKTGDKLSGSLQPVPYEIAVYSIPCFQRTGMNHEK